MARRLSLTDRLISAADQAIKTLVPNAATATRANPAKQQQEAELSDIQRKHSAGLMRINHTGEVCAQALYQGQALTAKLPIVRNEMEQAAKEEIDHLVWCEQRLQQLGSRTSVLNPAFYAMSFAVGAGAGLIGDKWSLGFVAATEEQVCEHLRDHLQQLPEQDSRSRVILKQMLVDEAEHGTKALAAGGHQFSSGCKKLMATVAKVMTKSTYRI